MSSEKVQEHIDEAAELVVVGDVDIDDAIAMFEQATERLEQVRTMRGER